MTQFATTDELIEIVKSFKHKGKWLVDFKTGNEIHIFRIQQPP